MKDNCGRNSGSDINNQFQDRKDPNSNTDDTQPKDRKIESKNGGLTYKPFNIQKQFNSNHSLNQQSSGEISSNSYNQYKYGPSLKPGSHLSNHKQISTLKAQQYPLAFQNNNLNTKEMPSNFNIASSSENNSQYLREEPDAKKFQSDFMQYNSSIDFQHAPENYVSHDSQIQSDQDLSKISNEPAKFGGANNRVKMIKNDDKHSNQDRSSSMDSMRIMAGRGPYFQKGSRQSSSSPFASTDKISCVSFDSQSQCYTFSDQNDQYGQNLGSADQNEIFQNYKEDLDFMDPIQDDEKGTHNLNANDLSLEVINLQNSLRTLKQQLPLSRESQNQLKALIELQQAFNRDKQKIQDKIRHCLICIYNQQDITEYFQEMMQISHIMKFHHENSANQIGTQTANCSQFQSNSVGWKAQLQAQTQPKILKQMISETIGEIMTNICEQIQLKMRQLGVIVKEPLNRRASHDDYNLCFETFNRKNGNSIQSYAQSNNIFGYGLGNYGVFTNHINLRNLNQKDEIDVQSQISQESSQKQSESKTKLKISQGHLNFPYKQQEMYLDDPVSYEEIRQEGRNATWKDIKQSRKRLQRFIHRQSEYKKIFDIIFRYYDQFKSSLEFIEEFWIFQYEAIYGKVQTGKLQFDRIWKDLFHKKVLENKYIQYFLSDISEQQRVHKQSQINKNVRQTKNKYILDEIYENLIKLENDLNQDFVVEDFLHLQWFVDLEQQNSNTTNITLKEHGQNYLIQAQIDQIVENQYDLISQRQKLKYGGKSLAQLISCKSVDPKQILASFQKLNAQRNNSSLSQDKQLVAPNSSNKKRKRTKQKGKVLQEIEAQNPEVPFQIPKKLMLNKSAKNQNLGKKGGNKQNDENQNCPTQNNDIFKAIISPLKLQANSSNAQNIQNNQIEQKQIEKKKKLNQKKKRQRVEKKKRLQEQENFDKEDEEQLNELMELIYRYDNQMSQADQDYLLQVQDREAVINTLQAKLQERNQIDGQQMNADQDAYYDEYGDDEQDYSEIYQNDEIYYQEDAETQYIIQDQSQFRALNDRQKLGLVHGNSFKMQNNQKSKQKRKSDHSIDSNTSNFEEEIYNSEFEEELKQFQNKLQTRESSSERQYHSAKRGGSQGRRINRKLIPNVTSEWINKLREKLKDTTYCRSQGNTSAQRARGIDHNVVYKNANGVTVSGPSKVIPVMNARGLNQCMTISTAGMSFNSPPATERACGYDVEAGQFIVDEDSGEAIHYYYNAEDYQQYLQNSKQSMAQDSYINIEDENIENKGESQGNEMYCESEQLKMQKKNNSGKQQQKQRDLNLASQHQSA